MQELRNFLQNQTHPYRKFTNEHAVDLLNYVAQHYNEAFNLTLAFSLNSGDRICLESDNMAYEVGVMPDIFKQFKKCYRCRDKCYEHDTRRIIRSAG
jgi:hypothetical protein